MQDLTPGPRPDPRTPVPGTAAQLAPMTTQMRECKTWHQGPTLAELFAAGDATPIATAYRRHGYTMREIAEHLGCHYSTVSRKLRREELPNA